MSAGMDDATLQKILAAYGIAGAQFFGVQKGYRNSSHHIVTDNGEHLNLIVYKSEPGILERIRRINQIGDILAAQDFPARQTYDNRILQLQTGKTRINPTYAGLYQYLPGETIPWEAYTMKHLKLLGKTMGDMHAKLQSASSSPEIPTVTDEYSAILRRMQRYFDDTAVRQAMSAKLSVQLDKGIIKTLTRLVEEVCTRLPGQQPLHMDFVRGNILFTQTPGPDGLGNMEPPRITGVLDFEKVATGHPVFDIARTYSFLLVDCKYKSEDKVRKYFLHSGYHKYSQSPFKLNAWHTALLKELTTMFLLYDFYKFLCHTPYEYLNQNEHYTRTRHILLQRGIIHKI